MKTYVLCNWYPDLGAGTFVCGLLDGAVTFDSTPEAAARFETVENAIAYRSAIAGQLTFGVRKYHAHELLPDGQLVDAEPGIGSSR